VSTEQCYKTLVRPQLEYSSSIWDNVSNATSTKSNQFSGTLHVSPVVITDRHLMCQPCAGAVVGFTPAGACSRVLMLYRIRNGLVVIPTAAYLEPVPICTRRFDTRYVQIQCNTGTYIRPSFQVQSSRGTLCQSTFASYLLTVSRHISAVSSFRFICAPDRF